MSKSVLYLGDTALKGPAGYLAGVMSHYRIDFDYIPSDKKFCDSFLTTDYKAIILSDYPSANFTSDQLDNLCQKVKAGTGLLMIGGWESFTGLAGGYNHTVLADVLPVSMKDNDDRINWSGPCMIRRCARHTITDGLDFENQAPAVGGFNQFIEKPQADVLLRAERYTAKDESDKFSFAHYCSDPLLVTGKSGKGKTAAFASDAAPHWVGPFVDWGNKRIIAQAKDSEQIEVGCWYAEFWAKLINWLLNRNEP